AGRSERSPDVDADDDADDGKRVPRRVHAPMASGQAHDRAPDDETAREDEDRSFGERSEMLGLAVTVLMTGVGGPSGDADGEERQEGCGEGRSPAGGLREGAAGGRL